MTRKNVEELKQALTKRPEREPVIAARDLLSTGSTLLNLACSGRSAGGFAKGKYIWFVGDSESGKTFLALTMFAEAARNPNFADYRLIYDNIEDGALMNWEEYFGEDAASRIEPPKRDADGDAIYSDSHEDFYFNLDDALRKGPCIYVLDSENALEPKAEAAKFKKQKAARNKAEQPAGDYGAAKAKLNSQGLRRARRPLRKNGSILLIISQTRDNIGAIGYADKKKASGGRALKFYAHLEVWTSVKGTITKSVRGKKRQVGVTTQVDVKKNRVQGKKRRIFVDILHGYGIDDIGSCVDYLLEEEHWKGGETIKAPEFDFVGTRDKLIKHIEEEESERQLRKLVASVWKEIEEKCQPRRKSRYGE